MMRILLPFVRRWRGRLWLKASAIASLILACVALAVAGSPAGEVSRLRLNAKVQIRREVLDCTCR
jgi:hypothetical protein